VAPAVQRLKQLHGRVQAGERLPVAAVTQLDVDLKTLAAHAEQQRQLEQVVSVNIQRHEAALFARLAQLQSAGAGGDASRQATAV
jgi:lipase chaperone LimK